MIQALIPVKRFDAAKSRLSSVLREDQRARLAEVMLRHTLAMLACLQDTMRISIVTSDARAAFLARQFGAMVIGDTTSNLNDALELGRQQVTPKPEERLLVLPADLPTLASTDIEELVTLGDQGARTVIVPAHDGEGTNALLLAQDCTLRFAFGPGSFQRHVTEAKALGFEPEIMAITGIAADLDHPDDIYRIAGLAPRSPTAALFRELGLIEQAELSEAS